MISVDASLHLAFRCACPGLQLWYLRQQQRAPFSMMAAAMLPQADQLQTAETEPCSENSHAIDLVCIRHLHQLLGGQLNSDPLG